MTQSQFEGILRHTLTLAAAVVLVFFNNAENMTQEIIAAGMALGSLIWSWVRKPEDAPLIDRIRGTVNHSIAILTAILVYAGKVDLSTTIEGAVAAVINLLPFILSFFDKKKQ